MENNGFNWGRVVAAVGFIMGVTGIVVREAVDQIGSAALRCNTEGFSSWYLVYSLP